MQFCNIHITLKILHIREFLNYYYNYIIIINFKQQDCVPLLP